MDAECRPPPLAQPGERAQLPQAVAQLGQAPGRLARGVVHADALAVPRALEPQRRVEAPRRRGPARPFASASPRFTSFHAHAGQVHRHALPRLGAGDGLVVDLHRADAHIAARREQHDRSPRPTAPDHSVPVTTVPAPRIVNARSTCSGGGPRVAATGQPRGHALQRASHRLDALAGPRRTGHELERLPLREQIARLRERALRRTPVHLRHGDDAAAHAQALEHAGVLDGLGHDPVVGGHRHERQVDPRRAGHHRAHESARGRGRRRPTAAVRSAAPAARSPARSTSRARVPPGPGRCPRR
jgi:hypothetical protein